MISTPPRDDLLRSSQTAERSRTLSWAGEGIRGPTGLKCTRGLNCTAAPRRAEKLPRSHATGRPGDPSQRDTPRRFWGAPRDAARDARAPPAGGTTNSPCTNLAPVRLAFFAAEWTGAWWYRPHGAPKTSAVSTGAQALSSSRGYVS